MRNFVVILALLCACLALPAQNNALLRSVAFLTGAEDVESLDQQEIDRYFYYAAHPLRINSASLSRLVSSGLFSQYQAASLLDYRQRQGDVLSEAELALVDGFGEETARALSLFVSFESDRLPGSPAVPARPSQTLKVKGSLRDKEGIQYGDGMQYLMAGESLEVNLAGRSTYLEAFRPTGSVAWSGRCGKVVVGDFHTRFGQGLALWTGFSVSGLSGASSFYKRPSGLSPSRSYSGLGTWRGLAADYTWKRLILTGFVAKNTFGGNATWFGKKGQVGLTAFSSEGVRKVSADGRFCLRGIDLFGEAAWDGKGPAFLAGAVFPVGDKARFPLAFRWYHSQYDGSYSGAMRTSTKVSDQCGLALGWEQGRFVSSLDLSSTQLSGQRQLKGRIVFPVSLPGNWDMEVRLSERWKNEGVRHRAGLRTDFRYTKGEWTAILRSEESWSKGMGWLGYLEGGRKNDRLAVWLRACTYFIGHWDNRIYCYERDAPGNFSVPAYYGNGFVLSALSSYNWVWKRSRLRAWLRLSTYPEAKLAIDWEF